MQRFLRQITPLAAAALLFSACHKKDDDANVAEEAETKLPPTEQVTPDNSSPENPSTPPNAATTTAPASQPSNNTAPGNANFEVWFRKYHLDLNDPKMLDSDPDSDGASNRDEFLADTDPHDPNSRPGIHKNIRLKEFSEVRLPIVVESVEGEKAHIRRTDAGGKSETVKAGDTLRGLPLKVEKVEQVRDTDKEGNPIDRSYVSLTDSGTQEHLMLVKDMPARTASSYAVLIASDGNTTVKVKQGETFKWPGDDSATYKVIDLRDDQVVLQQLETKKMWTVLRPSAAK